MITITDKNIDFVQGASGPRFFDTGKVKIGHAYVPGRTTDITRAETDIQGVFLGHFKPYPGKEKRSLFSRVYEFFFGKV